MADQLLSLDADIDCFQEIFEEKALQSVIHEADTRGMELNAAVIPDRSKKYRRKAVFRKLAYQPYTDAALAFEPNANDGEPGQRCPGLAILSRFGFVGQPEIIQDLSPALEISFGDAGTYTLPRVSRPIMKERIPIGGQVVTVFNCHLKSKLGDFVGDEANIL